MSGANMEAVRQKARRRSAPALPGGPINHRLQMPVISSYKAGKRRIAGASGSLSRAGAARWDQRNPSAAS